MAKNNITTVHLLGFPGMQSFGVLFFLILLIIYCLIIIGNIFILTLISVSKHLQSPMYFFLAQLSLIDILLATDIHPNTLHIILHSGSCMPFTACITQLSFFCILECSECLLLAVMSYDRYLAICKPLHYNAIFNMKVCLLSTMLTWSFGVLFPLTDIISVSNLQLCGSNVDHFFCDYAPVFRLSCSNTDILYVQTLVLCFFTVICPFLFIVMTYVCIICELLKIKSVRGRQKSFLTCSSHLIVVSIFYGTLISVYSVPTQGHLVNKLLSLLYTVVTPLLNPVIYTIRNKDVKEALKKLKTSAV